MIKFKSFLFFVIVLLLFIIHGHAQEKGSGVFKGRIYEKGDSLNKMNFKGATVSVLRLADSSLLRSAVADVSGNFLINGIPFGDYIFRVTYTGYSTLENRFSLSKDNPVVDIGPLPMERFANLLENIIIRSASMVINGDTTEFNASQFKTLPNASTEDLLKKMPGVEVDRDGSIKTQGEAVTRILVDGKPFYGNDPKLATRNLPADIIEKIQVIDALSDQSQFSGFDDGNRVRTINIITKKNRKKGIFGKSSFAYGSNDRNAHAISAHRLNGERKISFIAQYNNINNQNFTAQDFLGNLNPGDRSAVASGSNVFTGNANGISTTLSGSINYNEQFGKNTKVSASLLYSDIDVNNNRDRVRETFSANDSSFFNRAKIFAGNQNRNLRGNVEIDHMFDSANSILIKSEYNRQSSTYTSESSSFTTKGLAFPFSQMISSGYSGNKGNNISNSILYRHKFNKPGRTYSITLWQGSNASDRDGLTLTYNDRYARGKDTLDQKGLTLVDSKRWGTWMSFTEPLSTKANLEFFYSKSKSDNNSIQETLRRNRLTDEYSILVPSLSNSFANDNDNDRGGVNYRKQVNRNWSYGGGLALQHVTIASDNITKGTQLSRPFVNILPNFNFQYRKGKSKSLRFNYRGYTQQPYITQLQDVVNNSSLLYVRAGNPSLKQEFLNNFSLNYNAVQSFRSSNFYMNLYATFTSNRIANSVYFNTSTNPMVVDGFTLLPGGQYSKPENFDGAYDIRLDASYSRSFKNPRSMLAFSTYLREIRDVNMFNGVRGYTHRYIATGGIRATLNMDDYFDLVLSSYSTVNLTYYDIATREDVHFFNQRLSVEPTFTTKSGWIFSNDLDYIINRGNANVEKPCG